MLQIAWFSDWYKEKYGDPTSNANMVHQDSPLDMEQGDSVKGGTSNSSAGIDTALLTTVCQEVLRAMKEKDKIESSSANLACTLFSSIVLHAKTGIEDWIIDTGATDHMSFNSDLFEKLVSLPKLILVGLPDGSIKQVNQVGDIVLTGNIMLKSVLFVPEFKHNLL